MCGRYIFASEENEFIRRLIAKAEKSMKPEVFEEISLFDVFPGQKAIVMTASAKPDHTSFTVMIWGFAGRNSQMIINARSETAFQSSFFAGCLPCAIPASAYYEWTPQKHKYSFRIDEPFFLGGLCRVENNELHFVILTEEAASPQNEIHHRQPLLFTAKDAKAWTASAQPTLMIKNSVQKRIIEKA